MKPWRVKNFTARIIQHEMDHLNGVLCVDRMTSTQTLQFTYWQDVKAVPGVHYVVIEPHPDGD